MTTATTETKTIPRLKQRYRDEVAAKLREQFGYGNAMQVPTLVKIKVNMGVGDAAKDGKLIEGAVTYREFPLALTPEEESASYALACQALPASDLVIGPASAAPPCPTRSVIPH